MTMHTNFWLKYKTILNKHKIPNKSAEWYMRWIKSFEKTLPNVSLPERTKVDVQAYMDVLVRWNKYQDRQLEQAKKALGLLFLNMISAPYKIFLAYGYFKDNNLHPYTSTGRKR